MTAPNPRAVRTLAAMFDSERARRDAARFILPEWWPDEAARRIAAILIDGGRLKPADAETDRLEVAYWLAIARADPEPDAIVAMLAERERVHILALELQREVDRLNGGYVGDFAQARREVLDLVGIVGGLDCTMTALSVAGAAA